MPNERISMSKLKQLIGLQASNLSVRALARALGLSVGAVCKYLRAVRSSGIGASDAEALSEVELEQRVFGPTLSGKPAAFVAPDCAWIHGELKRHRHVTLQLLWEEYAARYGVAAYRRSAFCQIYRRWEARLKRSMRQRHFAGEKLFVDYAGRTVPIYGAPREPERPNPGQRLERKVVGLALLDLKSEPDVEIHLNHCVRRFSPVNYDPLGRAISASAQRTRRSPTNKLTATSGAEFPVDADNVSPCVFDF